jgi:hypothetical protein
MYKLKGTEKGKNMAELLVLVKVVLNAVFISAAVFRWKMHDVLEYSTEKNGNFEIR